MTEENGNKAFRNQLELRIEALKERGGSDRRDNVDTEIATLQALLDIHNQVSTTRKTAEKIAGQMKSFPSLTFLIMKRPFSTVPYLMAGFVGLSSLYISDIRGVIFEKWGLPADLFDITSERIIPVFLLLLVVGFLADVKYRDRSDE